MFGLPIENTMEEIEESTPKKSFWYENEDRAVIIEKYESEKLSLGYSASLVDSFNSINSIRFVDENEELHRNNGNPSFISNHLILWYKNGKLHRKNGKPAIIRQMIDKNTNNNYTNYNLYSIGTPKEEYWENGKLHRENDLPAVVFSDYTPHSYWFINGKLHREKGKPSIINGNFLYYHNNGILYKSEIKYNNKFVDWVLKNPFKLSTIVFIVFMLISIFLT